MFHPPLEQRRATFPTDCFFIHPFFFPSLFRSRARMATTTPCFHASTSARPPRLGRPVPCPPSRQFTRMINHLSLQGRVPLRSIHPVKLCTPHNNGICSYRRSAEPTRTHICSRIPQTINNSLLPFKSHFSDKVLTIRRNKLRLEKRGGGGEEVGAVLAVLDGGEKFFSEFFPWRADSSELAIISRRKLIKVAQS